MSIKYHDNINGRKYDENGKLTDNWNPDAGYPENEYARVYFRVDTPTYKIMEGGFSNQADHDEFYAEVLEVFKGIGWDSSSQTDAHHEKASVYIHPQEISGIVHKNDIKVIAEALENSKTFSIRWVDIYQTVYNISDEEYAEHLKSKTEFVVDFLKHCPTKRKWQFWSERDVAEDICGKIKLCRIGNDVYKPDQQTMDFIAGIIEQVEKEGYIVRVENDDRMWLRTINKTEQRKLKLVI